MRHSTRNAFRFAAAVGFLLLARILPASAAGTCTGTPQEISFANWAAAEAATAKEVGAAIAAFEQANPCIRIKVISIPYAEMVSQLTVMTIGNNTPDVMELSSGMPQAGHLVRQGSLLGNSRSPLSAKLPPLPRLP